LVRTVFKNKEGKFVLENLPLDKPYLFKIKGEDGDLPEDLKVIIKNLDGAYEVTLHKPADKKGFDYDFLPNDARYSLAMIEYSDEGELVFLEPEQKEVVEEAYTNLQFNFNSAVISPKSYAALDKLAELLKNNKDWKIKLAGYTDDVGDEITNLALSKRRADTVKKYLISKGVEEDRIIVKYYGEANPIAPNDSEENRRKNRRVEMVILK
ncbi:MAG: OmpA family protein, partial [Bacteroidetes bacterium]